MSVPTSGEYQAGGYQGAYAPPVNRVNFGWITESWQLLMAHTGIWITATLALIGPSVILGVGFYAYFMVSILRSGVFAPPPPGAALPRPVLPLIFAPSNIGKILTLEIGVGLVMVVYSAFLYGGMFRMALRQARGLGLTYRDIFAGGPLFGRMLGAMFLLGFGTYGLEAICVGPGYAMLWFHANPVGAAIALVLGLLLLLCLLPIFTGLLLPLFALIADGVPIFHALRRSIQAMKAHWLPATGFVFVMVLLVYVSELPCFIGLLATIPMVFLVTALAYRDMAGMPNVLPLPALYHLPAAPGVWPPAPRV